MIRANATRLKSRLFQIREAVLLVPHTVDIVAQQTIDEVGNNAVELLSARNDQVGFDLNQFLRNIQVRQVSTLGGRIGRASVLHLPTMGTAADFEAISGQSPILWHEGRGRAAFWRLAVFDRPAVRAAVARERQAIWGNTTPQWFLLNYGYSGGGVYPSVPASHFIDSAVRPDRIAIKMRNAISALFRGLPRS